MSRPFRCNLIIEIIDTGEGIEALAKALGVQADLLALAASSAFDETIHSVFSMGPIGKTVVGFDPAPGRKPEPGECLPCLKPRARKPRGKPGPKPGRKAATRKPRAPKPAAPKPRGKPGPKPKPPKPPASAPGRACKHCKQPIEPGSRADRIYCKRADCFRERQAAAQRKLYDLRHHKPRVTLPDRDDDDDRDPRAPELDAAGRQAREE